MTFIGTETNCWVMGIKKFNAVVQRSLGSRVIEMICFCHGCLAKSMWNRKCKFHV